MSFSKHIKGYENALSQEWINRYSSFADSVVPQVREVLPGLPDELGCYWFNQDAGNVVPGYVTGALAYSPSEISITLDTRCNEEKLIKEELKNAIFHEFYHLSQGFTFVDSNGKDRPPFKPIHNAIYEGAASLFEARYARQDGNLPYYADFTEHSSGQILEWIEVISMLPSNLSRVELEKWKFYNPDNGVNHIMYKIGAKIVDDYLSETEADISSISKHTPDEIFQTVRAS